jgi:hypothetical protein
MMDDQMTDEERSGKYKSIHLRSQDSQESWKTKFKETMKNHKMMNNGVITTRAIVSKQAQLLSEGWVFGKLPKKDVI